MMLFSGVRSSWLMLARKSLLSRFISYSRMFSWASWSTLASRSVFTLRSSAWASVRCRSMRLKALASSSNSSLVWMSARSSVLPRLIGVADVAQVLQRLDDHVADDHVQHDHGQEHGDDADRQSRWPGSR